MEINYSKIQLVEYLNLRRKVVDQPKDSISIYSYIHMLTPNNVRSVSLLTYENTVLPAI